MVENREQDNPIRPRPTHHKQRAIHSSIIKERITQLNPFVKAPYKYHWEPKIQSINLTMWWKKWMATLKSAWLIYCNPLIDNKRWKMNSHLLPLLEPIWPRIPRNSIPYEQREEEEEESRVGRSRTCVCRRWRGVGFAGKEGDEVKRWEERGTMKNRRWVLRQARFEPNPSWVMEKVCLRYWGVKLFHMKITSFFRTIFNVNWDK